MICIQTTADCHILDGKSRDMIDPFKIIVLSAEGESLDLILKRMNNVPHTDHWMQVWFGDMAQFVYRALDGIGYYGGKCLTHAENMSKIEKRRNPIVLFLNYELINIPGQKGSFAEVLSVVESMDYETLEEGDTEGRPVVIAKEDLDKRCLWYRKKRYYSLVKG